MPQLTFPFHAIWQELENGLILGEALLFPDLSRLARDRDRAGHRLSQNLALRLPKEPLGELYRHSAPEAVEVVEVSVSLSAPPKFPAWRDELTLTFPVVRWKHGNEAHLAYVPALGLEIAAAKAEELDQLLPKEI